MYGMRKTTKGTFDVPPGNDLHLCALNLLQCCNVEFTFDVPPGKSYVETSKTLRIVCKVPLCILTAIWCVLDVCLRAWISPRVLILRTQLRTMKVNVQDTLQCHSPHI